MESDDPLQQVGLSINFEVRQPAQSGMEPQDFNARQDRREAALIYDASLSSTASMLSGGDSNRTGLSGSGSYEAGPCGAAHSSYQGFTNMGHSGSQAEPSSRVRLGFEMATDRIEIDLFGSTRKLLSKHLAENVSKVTFPYFDPEKLKGIKLDLPFPVEQSMFLPPSPIVVSEPGQTASGSHSASDTSSSSRPNNQLVHVSHCRKQARLARQQVLFKIGMRSHMSENKKMLAAVQAGDIAKVSGLLHSGVSANVSDHKLRTPLHIAASQGHYAIASLLLAMHAEPNKQDILGNTPLHLAVCRGDRQIVKQLIENGGNIHLQDNTGRTPLSIVKARLNTLRKNRSISTEKLKGEFLLMWDFLKFHSSKTTEPEMVPVADLCNMMENFSTREEADEIADVMINKMSELCLVKSSSS